MLPQSKRLATLGLQTRGHTGISHHIEVSPMQDHRGFFGDVAARTPRSLKITFAIGPDGTHGAHAIVHEHQSVTVLRKA